MEQVQSVEEIQNEVKRLVEDMEILKQLMTDATLTSEDREFQIRTRQAGTEAELGNMTSYTEKEFKERWKLFG
tara:strand:+ start:5344 stop:5562 length:219 start_codon:yes stop_codon:yes gene_type:complete